MEEIDSENRDRKDLNKSLLNEISFVLAEPDVIHSCDWYLLIHLNFKFISSLFNFKLFC
jgi:hypothetical protein